METAIRKGVIPFYASEVFPYGLSRSSYFNKRESEELITYGHTFLSLQNGSVTPLNEEEVVFLNELNSELESSLYAVKLWKKYLNAVQKSRTFHGFSMSDRFQEYVDYSSNDSEFECAS